MMATVRRKTRRDDPAGCALLPKRLSCRIAKSRLHVLGCRAGPGVDWHRSSQSSKGPARTEKPVYSFNEPPIIPGYAQLRSLRAPRPATPHATALVDSIV